MAVGDFGISARWNGQVAADVYRGPVLKALKKHRGLKRKFRVLEEGRGDL